MSENYIVKSTCRLCGDPNLKKAFSLTPTPPANEFVPGPVDQEVYPLNVCECQSCGHVQITEVVDPNILFKNYVYVSGTSPVFVKHFDDYAQTVLGKFPVNPSDIIVEIGSNDGTLLNSFQKLGVGPSSLVGFEPAVSISEKANSQYDFNTINDFFDENGIREYKRTYGYRKARIVVANNVFAHADDLIGITSNIKDIMTPDGVFIFEVSYLLEVCKNTIFDSIYHEHLSYHSLHPLRVFFRRLGMNLFDVEFVPTHGGSIRCYVSKDSRDSTPELEDAIIEEITSGLVPPNFESGFRVDNPLMNLYEQVQSLKEKLVSRIRELKADGKSIACYGAPAKATTLMYEFQLDKSDIDFIIDDSPLKQGLLTPGKHIPVLPSSALRERKPDYLLILAWNFADSIIAKNQSFRDQGGKFIVPIPEFKEL